MPEEIVFLSILSIICATIVILGLGKAIIGYLSARSQPAAGDGITESQLRRLVREAVAEAVTPLAERVDQLEAGEAPISRRLGPRSPRADEASDAELREPAGLPNATQGR